MMKIQKVGLIFLVGVVGREQGFYGFSFFLDESAMHCHHTMPLLTLTSPSLNGFASLLQHGILYPVDHPVGLVPFLLSLPGFTEQYIEQTVQTIFINGVPADSLQREVGAGETLALSAAMPGLAGAIFRRQGLHGSLRSQPQARASAVGQGGGYLTLKLFNSIAADRIQDLLSHGFAITGKALQQFLLTHPASVQSLVEAEFDGCRIDQAELGQRVADYPLLRIQALPVVA